MATIFQTPKRLASFPARIPVYKIADLPSRKESSEYWHKRINDLSAAFGFQDHKLVDERESIFATEGSRILQVFKASDSFLYYDEDLVSPTEEDKNMMSAKTARDKAIQLIKSQNLVDDGAGGKLFQIYYGGDGYTMAQTASAGTDDDGQWAVSDESELYKTEIRSHFGYLLNGQPVFGPGAKTIISNVGDKMSEQIHFWRKPSEMLQEYEIIAPQTAISRLCKDKRFVKVAKANKKHPGVSGGRFYDDIELGYYATPPFNKQRFYIPVYKIRGTFESRENINGDKFNGNTETPKNFRYDFVHFVSALHGEGEDFLMKDFKRQIIC